MVIAVIGTNLVFVQWILHKPSQSEDDAADQITSV